jgi:hypothetical protein
MICRTLALPPSPEPAIAALSEELEQTYRTVIKRLPQNPAVRFERVGDRNELVLSHLDKLEEPASLIALRGAVGARLPPVDLPEIIVEIAARTGFAAAFTHISERASRASDLELSLCAGAARRGLQYRHRTAHARGRPDGAARRPPVLGKPEFRAR